MEGDGAGDGLCEDEERGPEDRGRSRCENRGWMQELAQTEELALFGCGVG